VCLAQTVPQPEVLAVEGQARARSASRASRALRTPASRTGSLLTPTDVDRFVERLVREVRRRYTGRLAEPVSPAEQDGDGVLLDVEIDGLRVVVMRDRAEHPQVVLSPREYEIARMVAKGYPNKTIAGVLEISPWTVSTHLRRVFAKLDVTCRAAMVARLLDHGLLSPQRPSSNGNGNGNGSGPKRASTGLERSSRA